MEKWKRRAFDLVASMIFGGKREMSVVPYYPQKTEVEALRTAMPATVNSQLSIVNSQFFPPAIAILR